MQAFMQSLQMRCPVAATSGLSTAAMASAPMEKPSLLRRFISEIFSSSGQPARVTPNGDFWNAPVLRSLQPARAAILALVVAPDAVVGVIERAHQVEAFVGQRKALAMTQHRPRQLQARDAVDHLGLDRHEMLEVELVRHLEQRPVAVALLALGMMQRPGGVARQRLDRGRRRLDLEVGADHGRGTASAKASSHASSPSSSRDRQIDLGRDRWRRRAPPPRRA